MPSGPMPGPRVDDPARGASLRAIGSASLLPDTEDQITAYSRSMGIPRERFGVDNDGQIIYSDPRTGSYTRVVPSVSGGSGITDRLQRSAGWLMSNLGPGISMGAGALGGMIGGPVTSVLTSAGASGGADIARQALGRHLAGLEPTEINWPNVGGQAALAAGGQAVGNIAGALASRNPLGVQTYDRTAAQLPANLAAWSALRTAAQRAGIDLDLAQTTNLPSLLTTSRQLRRYPETMDPMTAFYRRQQGEQVPMAFEREVGSIAGPARTVEEAAGYNPEFAPRGPTGAVLPRPGLRGGAGDIIERANEARTAAASPHYQAAFASGPGPDVSPLLARLDALIASGRFPENSAAARALQSARISLTREVPGQPGAPAQRVPTDNYEGMHNAKLAMDSALGELSRGGATRADIRVAERQLTGLQQELTGLLRRHNPEYEIGYQRYIAASPAVEAVERDLGSLARLSGDARVQVLDATFGPRALPERVARMRQAFLLNGRMDEWNGGFRTWLDGQLDNAMRLQRTGGEPGNVAGALYQAIREPRQWRVIEAALPADAAANLRSFTDVLQAASRVVPMGSPTATDLAAGAATGAERVGRGMRIAGRAFSPSTVLDAGNLLAEAATVARTPAARIQLMEALTSPDALRTLQRLRMMSPGSEQAMRLALRFMTNAGVVSAGSALAPPDARAPALQGPEQ